MILSLLLFSKKSSQIFPNEISVNLNENLNSATNDSRSSPSLSSQKSLALESRELSSEERSCGSTLQITDISFNLYSALSTFSNFHSSYASFKSSPFDSSDITLNASASILWQIFFTRNLCHLQLSNSYPYFFMSTFFPEKETRDIKSSSEIKSSLFRIKTHIFRPMELNLLLSMKIHSSHLFKRALLLKKNHSIVDSILHFFYRLNSWFYFRGNHSDKCRNFLFIDQENIFCFIRFISFRSI